MYQEHFPGRSLAPASPAPWERPARSPPARMFPCASGAARLTVMALSPLEKANTIRLFITLLPSAHKCLFSY